MFKFHRVLVLVAAASTAFTEPAAAQGPLTTAFTYQGELRQGGSPADGLFDMRFRLYDALASGTPQGGVVCVDNVAVNGGTFTVMLDFGSQYNGQRRFVEIEVRADSGEDCGVGSGYILLAPRQELTAVPHALYALGTSAAANASQLNGQAASFYTNASNLSSGTLSAARLPMPLSIAGSPLGGGTQEVFSVQNNAAFGVGIKSTAPTIGLMSTSTATTGFTHGGQFFSASSDGTALLAHATSTTGANIGISAKTSSTDGVAIAAEGGSIAIIGNAASPQGVGVYGLAPMHALFGQAYNPGGRGIETMAPADGYAGYFNGRGYFSDKVGMGTTSPVSGLHVVRNWDGEEGALRIEGDRPSMRLTGGAAAGSQSWLMHVGSDGPGNLGFHLRTGPTAWAPIMTLTPDGNIGIGTNGPGRALHVSDNDLFTARFANGHSTAAVVEFQNTTSSAVWEYGVAGSSPPFPGQSVPFAVLPGSMYIYKQGQARPGLSIDPGGTVRAYSVNAVSLHAGTIPWTDAVALSGRGNTHGVFASTPSSISTAYAVYGVTGAFSSPWAVYADGKFGASGTKSFRIDHPADPKNKFLLHYSAESPEVINFYSGTVALDAKGEAEVQLPSYFASINRDPRYSLTAVGAPMPNLHVSWEIDAASLEVGARVQSGDAIPVCWFRIGGGAAGAKVSWEVKAVRNDRWVREYGAPVEQDKGDDRGSYQRPELYGESNDMLPASHPNHPNHPLAQQSAVQPIAD